MLRFERSSESVCIHVCCVAGSTYVHWVAGYIDQNVVMNVCWVARCGYCCEAGCIYVCRVDKFIGFDVVVKLGAYMYAGKLDALI